MIQYVISLSSFLVPPIGIAHAAGLKIYKISLDPSNLDGRAQKKTVFMFFCLTFLQLAASKSQQRDEWNPTV